MSSLVVGKMSSNLFASLLQVQFRVHCTHIDARKLQGQLVDEHERSAWDLFITCQLFADGEALCLPEQTSHKQLMGRPTFNEWLHLPITLDALPLSTVAVFNVWDCASSSPKPVCVGGTSLPLFDEKMRLRKGRKKMYLWIGKTGDGVQMTTPWDAAVLDEGDRLDQCIVRYEKDKFDRIPWLDVQSFAEIRLRQEKAANALRDDVAFLHVEFPVFEHSVLFNEKEFITSLDESTTASVVRVHDPEMVQSNPVDDKYQRMHRIQIGLGANLKPTNLEKKDLARMVAYPTTKQLSEAEKNKIWMSRFYLKHNTAALPKFLLSVDWSLDPHSAEAIKLMREEWNPLTIEVALELLTSQFTLSNDRIHELAVSAIREHVRAFLDSLPDETLSVFLLQLVQAMRPERTAVQRPLSEFLVQRAQQSKVFGTHFFWYMKVEAETEDDDGAWYKNMVVEFLDNVQADEALYRIYRRQDLLVRTLRELYKHISERGRNRQEMIEIMQKEISQGHFSQLRSFAPLPFPLNPEIEVKGMIAEKCSVFKSAQKPLGLCFEKTDGSPYFVLFKLGDDLRCDQLVLQIISLMDDFLIRDGNLDMKLSPYRVLATGKNDGMIEIVPKSISIASCLKNYDNDIASYFRKLHPSSSGPFGMDAKVLDNFIRSCAGYCAITFLLGIGDRHLDNLLLTESGRLFHIDFGFILGEDPKSWPPPMKITREMVLAMGGDSSEYYYQFRNLVCEAYILLRRRSNIVITLFDLMLGASITNGHKVFSNRNDLFKIQDKYCLNETEESAMDSIQVLLQKSVAALMPRLMEDIHSVAQYWRN